MTTAWIAYGIVVGILVTVAAHGAQALARLAVLPIRWVWAGAIVLTLALTGLAPYRERASFVAPTGFATSGSPRGFRSTSPAMLPRVGEGWGLVASIEKAIALTDRKLPHPLDRDLIALWISVSSLLALGMIAVHVRLRRARRRWPSAVLRGVRVRVAPQLGPAVIGLMRPEIVVPQWLLNRDPEEQNLVLAHEAQHLRSLDPILLAAASVATVLVPWNPAIWWMLARLRLGVELDCDARVLRGGVAPLRYGALLIDLTEHCSAFRVGAPQLAGSSHLSHRLIAMKHDIPRFAHLRGLAIGALVFSSIMVACETSLPTADEVNRMDAPSAERAARQSAMLTAGDGAPVFSVDGAVVTANVARSIPQAQISSIEVIKSTDGTRPQIRISTHSTGETAGRSLTWRATTTPSVDSPNSTQRPGRVDPVSSSQKFSGIYLIDGARVDRSTVEALDPKTIVSVEVVKGQAASTLATLYNDPLAANGVISFATRAKKNP